MGTCHQRKGPHRGLALGRRAGQHPLTWPPHPTLPGPWQLGHSTRPWVCGPFCVPASQDWCPSSCASAGTTWTSCPAWLRASKSASRSASTSSVAAGGIVPPSTPAWPFSAPCWTKVRGLPHRGGSQTMGMVGSGPATPLWAGHKPLQLPASMCDLVLHRPGPYGTSHMGPFLCTPTLGVAGRSWGWGGCRIMQRFFLPVPLQKEVSQLWVNRVTHLRLPGVGSGPSRAQRENAESMGRGVLGTERPVTGVTPGSRARGYFGRREEDESWVRLSFSDEKIFTTRSGLNIIISVVHAHLQSECSLVGGAGLCCVPRLAANATVHGSTPKRPLLVAWAPYKRKHILSGSMFYFQF